MAFYKQTITEYNYLYTSIYAHNKNIIYPIHKEKSTKRNNVSKFYYSIFIWSSICFGRHTAHHQEPKTTLAAYGFSYMEGCWACSWWTLSGSCLTRWASYKYGIIKFWYIFAPCWIFLYEFYYDVWIHEHPIYNLSININHSTWFSDKSPSSKGRQFKGICDSNTSIYMCNINIYNGSYKYYNMVIVARMMFSADHSGHAGRRGSAAARLLELCIRMPPYAWDVCFLWVLCVVCRGLCVMLIFRPREA